MGIADAIDIFQNKKRNVELANLYGQVQDFMTGLDSPLADKACVLELLLSRMRRDILEFMDEAS
jgi:hypothetical protein